MATYAKLVDGQLITTCATDEEIDLIQMIEADGFKIYDENAGEPEIGKFQSLNPVYHEVSGKITLFWEIVDDADKIKAEINRLEAELATTDYQVIKSYEYALAGIAPAYDFMQIHPEREGIRVRIRELEQLLEDLNVQEPMVPEEETPPGIPNPGNGDDGDIPATPI